MRPLQVPSFSGKIMHISLFFFGGGEGSWIIEFAWSAWPLSSDNDVEVSLDEGNKQHRKTCIIFRTERNEMKGDQEHQQRICL